MTRRDFGATSGAERPGRLALLGLLVVPLVIGGILAWALATPAEPLGRITAAIVNADEPITVNDQTVPLGRQFAAGLMAAQSPPQPSSAPGEGGPDASDVAQTPSFSWVLTNADDAASGLASGAYAAVVTIPPSFSADALSFSGPAADARQATIEVETTPASAWLDPALTAVVTQVATAELNRQLIEGYLGQVYGGFNTISEQIGTAADGAAQLSTGASETATGAEQLAGGTADLASGLSDLAAGASVLASGLAELDTKTQDLPADTAALSRLATGVATAVGEASSQLDAATARFTTIVEEICLAPGPGTVCERARAALRELRRAGDKVDLLARGANGVAQGNQELAQAMPSVVSGIDSAATGSQEVSSGADSADTGGAEVASGAADLAEGAAQVDEGAADLASGLADAAEQIPTYSDDDVDVLASVVSQPVRADQSWYSAGQQSAPLFAMIALWLGGLVIALVYPAVPPRRLLTSASSLAIAGRAILPVVVIGAIQGVVVAAAVLAAIPSDPGQWSGFAAAAVLSGAVFAVANLSLAAILGGVGRVISIIIAVFALAAGLSGTVPPVIAAVAAGFPTAPGLQAMRSALTGDVAGGFAAAGVLLLIGVISSALVFAGVAARRRGSLEAPAA